MSSNFKAAGIVHPEPARGLFRVAIVGAASLKGKEVAEALDQRNFPSADIKLLDDDESLGQLEALKDEITFIQTVRAEQFQNVDFAFFACDEACSRKNWKLAQKAGSAIVDLSYALENEPGAALRAPWVEHELGQAAAPELQPGPAVVAHPAAIALGLLLVRLNAAVKIQRAVATVFEPVSERGQGGMDELHEQTVNLLSFQELPKKIYDAQVAFNMVARYGGHSGSSLETVQKRIADHYRRIVGDRVPVPSLAVLQAPTFHSYAVSINVEFENAASVEKMAKQLAGEHVSVLPADESPTNVSAAGQGEILVSVSQDDANERGLWLWAALDNLRVAAVTAVECAEAMAASRPRGQIQ